MSITFRNALLRNITTLSFFFSSTFDLQQSLLQLKQSRVTTIVAIVVSDHVNFLKGVKSAGMLEAPYVWILSEAFTSVLAVNDYDGTVSIPTAPELLPFCSGLIFLRPIAGKYYYHFIHILLILYHHFTLLLPLPP